MKKSLKLLIVAGMFMFTGGVSATHSRVIPDGTPFEWMKRKLAIDWSDPFLTEISRSMCWNYNEENGSGVESWTDKEVNAKVDEIYGYAMREVEKICSISGYVNAQDGVNSSDNGFGSKSFVIQKGSNNCFSADQLGDPDDISFSTGEIAESGFMAYLIVKGCFKWVEKSNGSHLLIPSGIPSKRKIKELFVEFQSNRISSKERGAVERQRKESKRFVAKNNEIGTGAMSAR